MNNSQVNYVAVEETEKSKKKPLLIGIGISLGIVILCLVGYFVLFPILLRNIFNKPSKVFDSAINMVQDDFDNKIDDWYTKSGLLELNLNVDSDYETIKFFSGHDYSFKLGIDTENKLLELGYDVKSDKTDIGQRYYVKNNDLYVDYSNYDDLIFLGNIVNSELNSFYEKTFNDLHSIGNVSSDDLKYLNNKIISSFKDSIDDNNFVQEETKINIDNNSYKVFKCKYEMNKDLYIKTRDKILNDLFDDEKALNIIVSLTGMSKEEIESKYKKEVNDDYTFTINVYSHGIKGEVIGIELSNDDGLYIHYYSAKDVVDIKINGLFKKNFYYVGNKKKKDAKFSLGYGDDKFEIVVHNFEDTDKNIDYDIIYKDQKIKGNGKISYNFKGKEKNCKLSLNGTIDDYYVNINSELKFSRDVLVADINTDSAKTLNANEYKDIASKYNNMVNTSPLGVLFQTTSGINDPDINGDFSLILKLLEFLPSNK